MPLMLNAQERIELPDGSMLSVFLIAPTDPVEKAPLVILMGGGPGNFSISRDTSQWLGSGFADAGWYVAVPVSPNNQSFRGSENNQKIEQLISLLQQREMIAAGKILLAGVSNGGMSALEIAQRNSANYFGVAAVPALFKGGSSAQNMKGLPVYLRIGGQDQLDWAEQFDDTVQNLTEAGVQLDAEIIDGAPHMFRMDWSTLGPWLDTIQ